MCAATAHNRVQALALSRERSVADDLGIGQETDDSAGINEMMDLEMGTSELECDIEAMPASTYEMNQKIQAALLKDEEWSRLIQLLTGKTKPSTSRCRRKMSMFVFRNGLLHKIVKSEAGSRLALVVPSEFRALTLHNAHDARISGHQGYLRTYRRLQGRYYWNSMLRDVKDYVGSCVTCASMKSSTLKPMGFFASNAHIGDSV